VRIVRWAGAAGIVLTVGLAGTTANVAAMAAGDGPALELRVITYAALEPADLDIARQTAQALLASAGLHVGWRTCSGNSCAQPSAEGRFVLVHLLPIAKGSDPTISGEVVRDPTTKIPTVLVYVPRNEDVTKAIRRSAAGRAHPAISTLATGHVVGLTIAHEVGHSLGLGHWSSGPMKAQPAPEDIIALRTSMLRFRPAERDTMQQVLRSDAVPVVAQAR
jgi:hypothetical protein